ncbi:hypothetical protein NPIL_178691 [Nephila pilipes]|uniref:Uncharacterized protein n=1 Tax=Nephila pilipes TaxID=299642 RepID=A0A8X6N541_NEPPI|nr:hypothetical protein NPIL_178691 [Nephila pilipes]
MDDSTGSGNFEHTEMLQNGKRNKRNMEIIEPNSVGYQFSKKVIDKKNVFRRFCYLCGASLLNRSQTEAEGVGNYLKYESAEKIERERKKSAFAAGLPFLCQISENPEMQISPPGGARGNRICAHLSF